MSGKTLTVLSILAFVPGSLPSFGQIVTATRGNPTTVARTAYTAEYRITTVQTLADGNTITRESTEVLAVDGQGRRMMATTTVPGSSDQTPRTMVSVFDPVARTNTHWASPGKQATVFTMPAPGEMGNCPAAVPDSSLHSPPRVVHPTIQDLGTDTIQGAEAHGHLITITTPAGAMGNAEPLVHTTERWVAVAPGLAGLTLREKTDDPRMGTTIRELTSLTQGDPDANIFQPPAGYEIVKQAPARISCGGLPGKLPDVPGNP